MKSSDVDSSSFTFDDKKVEIPDFSKVKLYKMSNRNATKYTDRYENWGFGTLSIKATGGALVQLTAEYGKTGRYSLYPIDDNVFVGISKSGASIIGGNQLFSFSEDDNGKMKKVEVSFEPLNLPIFERSLGPEPPVNHEKCVD